MLFYQPNSGYCYNSDSIILYGFISRFKPKGRMLDVGTGCGIVGLLVAKDHPSVMLEGIEKQAVYAEFARRNAQINKIPYSLHEGDFLEFDDRDGFDWIVSNPPFYHEGSDRSQDPMLHQARYNVHLPLPEFAKKIARLLRPKGEAALCYDARQFPQLCCAFEDAGLRVVDVQFLYSKSDRPSTVVMVHVKKNSRSMTHILPPFVMFEGEEYTSEAEAVYQKAKAHSIKCPIS